jgi:L-serine dehydratase
MKMDAKALREKMGNTLRVMRESVTNGMNETSSASGLSGGFARKLETINPGLLGETAHLASVYALAISEHNACMGRIASAPTAGSCGILPGALLALGKTHNISDERLTDALFTAAAVGMVVANNATLSGAKGGCAAECGSASAMAAAAIVELLGGTPTQCADACALGLKAVMGLVCDPVAGLVEVPCVKRNATGTVLALTVAELALAGIPSAIPADEVIGAMRSVGSMMHESLRETSKGGIAVTKTAKKIENELKNKEYGK